MRSQAAAERRHIASSNVAAPRLTRLTPWANGISPLRGYALPPQRPDGVIDVQVLSLRAAEVSDPFTGKPRSGGTSLAQRVSVGVSDAFTGQPRSGDISPRRLVKCRRSAAH